MRGDGITGRIKRLETYFWMRDENKPADCSCKFRRKRETEGVVSKRCAKLANWGHILALEARDTRPLIPGFTDASLPMTSTTIDDGTRLT